MTHHPKYLCDSGGGDFEDGTMVVAINCKAIGHGKDDADFDTVFQKSTSLGDWLKGNHSPTLLSLSLPPCVSLLSLSRFLLCWCVYIDECTRAWTRTILRNENHGFESCI